MSPTKFARNTASSSNRPLALQIYEVVMAGADDDHDDNDIIDANDEDSNDNSIDVGEG